MPHCAVVRAWCSPIDSPVRGSALRGISGTTWPGRRAPSSFTRSAGRLLRFARMRMRRRSSLSATGASLVVSTPPAIPDLDLADGDLAGHGERGLQAGVARLLDVVGGRGGVQRRAEHALAREVEVAAVLEHGARHDAPHPLALQPEAGDEPVERGGEHVLVGGLGVRAAGAGEGDAVAAEDRGMAQFGHRSIIHTPAFICAGSGYGAVDVRPLPAVRRLAPGPARRPPPGPPGARSAAPPRARAAPARGPGAARRRPPAGGWARRPPRVLAEAGAEAWVLGPDARAAARAGGLRARDRADEDDPLGALILDASGIARSEDLRAAYALGHDHVRQLVPSGRLLVLGTPPGGRRRRPRGRRPARAGRVRALRGQGAAGRRHGAAPCASPRAPRTGPRPRCASCSRPAPPTSRAR